MSISKELRLLLRRDDPVAEKVATGDGVLYLKNYKGKPELYLHTSNGIIRLTETGASAATTALTPGSSIDNAVALWDGTSGISLKQTADVTITSTINSGIPIEFNSGGTPAASGDIRFYKTGSIAGRNSADADDINGLVFDGNDSVRIGGNLGSRLRPSIVYLDPSSTTYCSINGTIKLEWNTGSITSHIPLTWAYNTPSAPSIYQVTDSTGSATGDNFTIHAQDCSGATSTGGALTLRSGDGTNVNGGVFISEGTSMSILSTGSGNLVLGGVGAAGTRPSLIQLDSSSSVRFAINGGAWYILTNTTFQTNVVNFEIGSTVTSPIIYQADDTTGSVTGDTLTVHAQDCTGATSTGGALTLRSGDGTSTDGELKLIRGTTMSVLGTTSSQVTIGGVAAAGTRPSVVELDGSSTIRLRINGGLYYDLTGTRLSMTAARFEFSTGVASPSIIQADDTTGSATGDTLTIHAQDCTGTTSTGGGLILRAGTGTSAGGSLELQDSGGTPRVYITAANETTVDSTSIGSLSIGGSPKLRWLSGFISLDVTTAAWGASVSTPSLNQTSSTTATTGQLMTIHAQDLTTASGAKTAGGLYLRAGTSTGGTSNVGGNLTLQAGTGDGVTTAGNIYMSLGSGASGISIMSTAASTNSLIIGGTTGGGNMRPDITLDGNTYAAIFRRLGTWIAAITTSELDLVLPLISFRDTVSSPTMRQDDETGAGVSGELFTIHAQDCTGTGTKTAGELFLRAGNASGGTDTGGDLVLQCGQGDSFITNGNIYLNDGDGYNVLRAYWPGVILYKSNLAFDSGTSSPKIFQADEDVDTSSQQLELSSQTNSVNGGTGGTLYIHAGNGTNGTAGSGGDIMLDPGFGQGSGTDGNIALFVAGTLPSWNSMEYGMFIGNATTVPTGNPSSGVYMYAEGGALKAWGSSGTTTTMAAADPHCPKCGRDCAVEWVNKKNNWEIAVCLWCVTDALGDAGVIRKIQW